MNPERLKSIPLFESLPDESLREVALLADENSAAPGDHLVEEGDFSYDFMAIESGSAKVLRSGEEVAKLGPGDFFGEIGLIEKDKRTATVVAESDVQLVTLSSWDLKRLEKESPEAFEQIRKVMEQRQAPS